MNRVNFKLRELAQEAKDANQTVTPNFLLDEMTRLNEFSRFPKNILKSAITNFIKEFSARNSNKILPYVNENKPKSDNSKNPNSESKKEGQINSKLSEANESNSEVQPQQIKKKKLKRRKPTDSDEEDIIKKLVKQEVLDLSNFKSLTELGGFDKIKRSINELILTPIQFSWCFQKLNVSPPKGILITGPPGSGKTTLAYAVAKELKEKEGVHIYIKNATEIVGGISGASEENLRKLFEEANNNAPALIFLDEIDTIAGKRENASKDMERRIVSQLMSCLDSMNNRVFVISTSSRPESLDPSLRRAGRFDREISIPVPDQAERLDILKGILSTVTLENNDFHELSMMTPGYVAADLDTLVREAALATVTRFHTENPDFKIKKSSIEEEQVEIVYPDVKICMPDFLLAITKVQPTAKREGFATVPDVTWDDIGALEDLKEQLHVSLILPILKAESYKKLNIKAPAGVLLYGAPGCGKTMLAKAIANASRSNFISVKGPELLNKYVGESEKAVRTLFARARSSAPCVIFFDELDAICPKRGTDSNSVTERVVNQLLTEMDGLESRREVFIIAATNRPDILDPAMLRPGRLDKLLYVPMPSSKDRLSILQSLTSKTPMNADVNIETIAYHERCNYFSGADLASLVKEAGVHAILDNREEILMKDFEEGLAKLRPSLNEKTMQGYEKIRENIRGAKLNI